MRHPDNGVLRDRRADDPSRAELRLQVQGNVEGAAEVADVLTDDEDPLVVRHLFAQGLVHRCRNGHLAHRGSSCRAARSDEGAFERDINGRERPRFRLGNGLIGNALRLGLDLVQLARRAMAVLDEALAQ